MAFNDYTMNDDGSYTFADEFGKSVTAAGVEAKRKAFEIDQRRALSTDWTQAGMSADLAASKEEEKSRWTAQAGGASGDAKPQAPAAPPPPAANFSAPEENVSRESPPAPPPPPEQPTGPKAAPRAPPLGGGKGEEPGPAPRPRDKYEELQDRLEEERLKDALSSSPGRRVQAQWLDRQRSVERREAPIGALKDLADAQDEEARIAGEVSQSQAESREKVKGIEKGKEYAANELEFRQKFARDEHLADVEKIDKELEEERKRLKNPSKEFWNSRTTEQKIAAAISTALFAVSAGLSGQGGDEVRTIVDGAIKRDMETREKNIGLLGESRKRLGEKLKDQLAAQEVAYNMAIRQVDDQIKSTVADAANPVIREMIKENVSYEGPEKIARVLLNKIRGVGNAIKPGLGGEEDPGPPPTQIEVEKVRYLAAELAQAQQRVQLARERLGIVSQYTGTERLTSEFQPERVVGGKARDLKGAQAILDARRARGQQEREFGLKEAEVTGKIGKEARSDAERAQARTVILDGVPYEGEARSDAEYQKLREKVAGSKALREVTQRLDALMATTGSSISPEKRAEITELATKAYEIASTQGGQGVLNKEGYDSAAAFATNLLGGKKGVTNALRAVTTMSEAATVEQFGLKPRAAPARPAGGRR